MEFKTFLKTLGKTVNVQVEFDGYKPLGANIWHEEGGFEIDIDDLTSEQQTELWQLIDEEAINRASLQEDNWDEIMWESFDDVNGNTND